MRPPSEPKIDQSNSKMWFIFWNHDVPVALWETYKRKRIRIKIYENINRYKGNEPEEYAKNLLAVWKLRLFTLSYNPFEAELEELKSLQTETATVETKIIEEKGKSHAEIKGNTSIIVALNLYLDSRIERTDNANSISTHRGVVKWFTQSIFYSLFEYLFGKIFSLGYFLEPESLSKNYPVKIRE